VVSQEIQVCAIFACHDNCHCADLCFTDDFFYGYVDKEDHAQPAPVPSPVAVLYGHDGPSGSPAHLFVI
jgi:hypothetical protein